MPEFVHINMANFVHRNNNCQLTTEPHSLSPHTVKSEVDTRANDVSYDVINQPTPSEFDRLKTNEAYTMVMTCDTNPSYTVVEHRREN